ncbi:MAG TPA: phage terminase small subunit P27 family [Smithellaceae bacterium]|jgi:P27 family predicted phage terminase small subunit|nr:phage terminase small subunit P27 family [Smithellaceae bacterium]HRS90199.1 phage terminase small subunit P27 family [Smithellaceae bacterium]
MRGRKPKPTKLKILMGNPGHRPLPENELQLEVKFPACPDGLSPEAKKIWKREAKKLEPSGILTELDQTIFAMYCESYATWSDAVLQIAKRGVIVGTKTGFPIQNPYVPVKNTAWKQMKECLVEMGMTPSSRSRVAVNQQPNKITSKKERFFAS